MLRCCSAAAAERRIAGLLPAVRCMGLSVRGAGAGSRIGSLQLRGGGERRIRHRAQCQENPFEVVSIERRVVECGVDRGPVKVDSDGGGAFAADVHGEQVGFNVTPLVALAYGIMAGFLYLCGRLSVPATEAPVLPEPVAAE